MDEEGGSGRLLAWGGGASGNFSTPWPRFRPVDWCTDFTKPSQLPYNSSQLAGGGAGILLNLPPSTHSEESLVSVFFDDDGTIIVYHVNATVAMPLLIKPRWNKREAIGSQGVHEMQPDGA